jgi:hypothetical protein
LPHILVFYILEILSLLNAVIPRFRYAQRRGDINEFFISEQIVFRIFNLKKLWRFAIEQYGLLNFLRIYFIGNRPNDRYCRFYRRDKLYYPKYRLWRANCRVSGKSRMLLPPLIAQTIIKARFFARLLVKSGYLV